MSEENENLKTVRHAGSWAAILYVVIKVLQVIYEWLAGSAGA